MHLFRYFLWIIFLSLPLVSRGDSVLLSQEKAETAIDLEPLFVAIEDPLDSSSALTLAQQTSGFVRLDQFNLTKPDETFWLKTTLKTPETLNQTHFSLSFHHLTFVDLYIIKDGKEKMHRKAGAFRKRADIEPEDSRFNFDLTLSPGSTYQLLLKVKHTKKYPPNFDFVLQSAYSYLSYNRTLELTNVWLQGAITILFFYAGLSWIINRYRPFLWVTLFILGVGLYCFSLQPAFIDILFPMQPETGWLLVLAFLHIGVVGFYLLMLDFLEMKKNAPKLYQFGRYIIIGLLIFSALSIIHNSLTSNYYLTNQINLSFSLVHLSYITCMFIVLWHKLNTSQRFLMYGIIGFGLAAITLVGSVFLFKEQSLIFAPILSKTTIVFITILFLTGINHKLRQHEREKMGALEQLNRFHKEQTSLIEQKVEERTAALRNMNDKLKKQQKELIEKRERINTLMDELNHRVKNNLQMLYSLSSLQLPKTPHGKSTQVLDNMRGRIKAMILVNEHLNFDKEKKAIHLSSLAQEIQEHLQHIYDPSRNIQTQLNVAEELLLNASIALPFGLILTELFTNTFKHAFSPDFASPTIKLTILSKGKQVQFTYQDNGKGAEELITNSSLGISLIQDLIRQLKGSVKIDHQAGFTYFFTFPNSN